MKSREFRPKAANPSDTEEPEKAPEEEPKLEKSESVAS